MRGEGDRCILTSENLPMLEGLYVFVMLLIWTLPITGLAYIFASSLAADLYTKRPLPSANFLSIADGLWLASPTVLSLTMLLFAAFHRGGWRDPVNENDLFVFHVLTFSVVPLTAYVVWRLRWVWLVAVVLCLPQLWQVCVSYFLGYMAITGRWI